jgi:small subunit ribosomal protein S10
MPLRACSYENSRRNYEKIRIYEQTTQTKNPHPLKGVDPRQLDRSTADIVETAKRTGARAVVIPMPTKREIFTVLRSPHVDRKSREQFEMRTHIRTLDLLNPTLDTIDKLKFCLVASGVDIKIKA